MGTTRRSAAGGKVSVAKKKTNRKKQVSTRPDAASSEEATVESTDLNTVTIEACKQWGAFKSRAAKIQKAVGKKASVKINEEKPGKGNFVVRVSGCNEPIVELLGMKRPFPALKALDMDKVNEDVLTALESEGQTMEADQDEAGEKHEVEESPESSSEEKTVTIEACKQWQAFKTRAAKIQKAVGDKAVFKINENKPGRGNFVVRVSGSKDPIVELLSMKRPFPALKALDMEEVNDKVLAAIDGK